MDARDALLLIDLDKGGEQLGPLFEEPRRRVQEDPQFRTAWSQYQAVKALAWETAPDLDERLLRQGLQSARRQEVERRLARTTGSQDAARELLLEPGGKRGLPAWASFLLLAGAVGLGWMAFGPGLKSQGPEAPAFAVADKANTQANGEEPLAFEFPEESDGKEAKPPSTDETRAENPDARRARKLLQAHLHRNDPKPLAMVVTAAPALAPPSPVETPSLPQASSVPTQVIIAVAPSPPPSPLPTAAPSLVPTAVPTPLPTHVPSAVPTQVPTALPTHAPTKLPTKAPTQVPTHAPTSLPTAVPTRMSSIELLPDENPTVAKPAPTTVSAAKIAGPKRLEGMAVETDLTLSSPQFPAQATLSLPEKDGVDLRLFDMRGRLVRLYAKGEQGPGRWRYNLSASDDQGPALTKGSYYLRVQTNRGFSKVEALEQP
jgi:hypothetical protein